MRVLTALAVGIVAFCCSGLYAEQEEGPANVQNKSGEMKWCGNNGHRCRLWRWTGPTGPMGPEGPAGNDSTVQGPQGPVGDKGNPGPAGIVEETNYVETVANFSRAVDPPLQEVFGFSDGNITLSGFLPLALTSPPLLDLPSFLVNNGFIGSVDGQYDGQVFPGHKTFCGVRKTTTALCEIDFDVDFLTTTPDAFPLTLWWGTQSRTFWFTPVALPGQGQTYYGVTGSRRAIVEIAAGSDVTLQTGVGEASEPYISRFIFRQSADTTRLTIREIQPSTPLEPL